MSLQFKNPVGGIENACLWAFKWFDSKIGVEVAFLPVAENLSFLGSQRITRT